jgi:O-antigen/teichoic acid export membrane protein
MSSVKRRLLASFGANSLGRLTSTIVQLVTVPLFLRHWGGAKYGDWVILSTIPTYFGMSDIGFGTVAGNEMTLLMARENVAEALEVFQSVWVLTTMLSSFVALVLVASIRFLPLNGWLHLHSLSVHDARYVVLFLGLSVLLSMQETFFGAAFRCVGLYAYGMTAKSLVVLASFGVIIVPLTLGVSAPGVAFTYLVANATGTGLLWYLLRRKVSWIRFGVAKARWTVICRLSKPAVSMMGLPIASLLSIQGVLLVIGHVLGPVAVVTFSTARTVSRSASQVMALINNSVWPELSTAYGAGNMALARQLHRKACQLSIFLCLCVTLLVGMIGKYVWGVWTLGKIPTDSALLDILLVQLLVSSLWYTSSVVPLAINKHERMTRVLVVSSALSLLLSWVLVRVPSLQVRGAAIGLLLGDVINAIYVLKMSLALLDDKLPHFLNALLRPPSLHFFKAAAPPKSVV